LEQLLNLYLSHSGASYTDIKNNTKIIYDPCDPLKETNKDNIDFIPTGSTDEQLVQANMYFSQLLNAELRLRGLSLSGTREDRRNRLKARLKVEQQLSIISQAVERGVIGKEAALMLIEQAIPCIMHLENRVGEKLITVLLAMGAERFQRQRGTKSLKRYVSSIQHLVNNRILGSIARPKQWKVPLNEAGDSVNKVTFSNQKTRLFVDNIFDLIDYIFLRDEDAELRNIWRKMITDYRDALIILRQREEYTDQDIETFQAKMDDFFVAYVEKSGAGKEGITNYIHMLGSAHVKHYMKRHRNLYKFSQQGWESLNEKVKLIFFNHSQRGGNYGSNVGENQRHYLKTIFMTFQRELLWISGVAENHFCNALVDEN